jgi:hypothetical protein
MPTTRTKAADALAVVMAEGGPAAKALRKAIDRARLRRAWNGERIPWQSIALIEKLTKGRVKAAWWSVAAVGPPPCTCRARCGQRSA